MLQRRAAAEAEAAEAELFAAQAKASLRAAREAEAVEQLFGEGETCIKRLLFRCFEHNYP